MENKRVALYIRVSSEEQAKHGMSLEAQLKTLNEYCQYKGWISSKVYREEGVSAGSIKRRKAFKTMLNDCKNGKYDIILVTKFDRLFRNVIDSLQTLEELRVNDIDFVSVAEDIDTTTPMGMAMFTIISVFAELERKMNTMRVDEVRKLRFEEGLFPSRSFYGYRPIIKGRKIVAFKQHKKEADKIKEIFELRGKNKSFTSISKEVKMPLQSVINIISNKVYYGIISYKDEEKKGVHEPIITEEVFNKANGI